LYAAVIARAVGVEHPRAETRERHAQAVVAPGEPVEVRDRLRDHEAEGERGHGQVEAVEPEARDAEGQADEGGDEPGREQGQGHRQRGRPQGEDRRGVGPDGEEAGVAERELVGVAREQVEPDRHDRVHRHQRGQEHEVPRRHERPPERGHPAQHPRRSAH
jgi:hypothetical protein